MGRLRVLVLFGGMAEEHDVSVKSARQLTRWLNPEKYEVAYLYIGRDGSWRHVHSPDGDLARGDLAMLSPNRAMPGLWILDGGALRPMPVDAVFPALHGRFGEDGTVQGLLELAGIPYAGCGVSGSVLCMDKALTHQSAARAGVAVPRHAVYSAGREATAKGLDYPVFVKPARSGSSFGVNQVRDESGLAAAVEAALQYDDKVLIEEAVAGREIGCALLGDGIDCHVGALDEIELSDGFFRIHQQSHPEQGCENAVVHVPARITEETSRRVIETAKTVYRGLGLEGISRVDMFLKEDGTVVLNEVNTMPGLTSYSRYPRMMQAAGISMARVVDQLIRMAMDRARGLKSGHPQA